MVAFTGLIVVQSCTEKDGTKVNDYYAFSDPVATAPADGETLHITGTNVDLTWASTSESGFPVKADVYFGTSEEPDLYKADHNALTINVPVELGITYYWYVVMIDGNGITTESPLWSFTIFEPIGIFVGDFNCDEPEEAYSYDVAFAKTSPTTLEIDNYWNSGWVGTFTLDFTANTYDMPLTQWDATWSSIESGTIDPETGTMVGHYIVYQNGVNIEEGEHTYTKL